MAVGDNLLVYTYDYLLAQALARVPDTLDKREGSIIFDALAPACYELAIYYEELWQVTQNTYIATATGEWLDLRVQEFGIARYEAAPSTRRGDFIDINGNPAVVEIGTRWSIISTRDPLIYDVIDVFKDSEGNVIPGSYELRCETPGIIGQEYYGPILPIDYVPEPEVTSAMLTTVVVPGRDQETDEELRSRYLIRINQRPFAGNVAAYDQWVKDIPGVGDLQVWPIWDGGGTVKLSVIDAAYNGLTPEFVAYLQEQIDPENVNGTPVTQGTGLGLAPIGAVVTVVTPNVVEVNVTATLALDTGFTVAMVQQAVENAISALLLSLRQQWGIGTDLNEYSTRVYIAQVISSILPISGILNVSDVYLNGVADDLVLREDAQEQELPVLGTVTLYA